MAIPSLKAVLAGERLALARLLTQVENNTPAGREALDGLFAHTGRAHLVGVTGSPGTGKSTLVNMLALALRRSENPCKVAVVAVDPSSPFTGGALLGDRVRMRDLAGDPGVFVRSMASRGALGGLARATAGVAQVLDAAGFDVVIIETVGAGQSEVDIARLAHTTLVVEAPGLGDDIQAIKAGILEIADILVINKADLPGADNTERSLRMMLELADPGRQHYTKHHELEAVDLPETVWRIPVIKTVAAQGQGIDELAAAVAGHRDVLRASGEWQIRDQARLQGEFDLLLQSELLLRWRSGFPPEQLQELQKQMFARQLSPYQAARICVEQRQK